MPELIATQCCVAGGGPAGLMAGFLLARAGVDVVVIEKHADFLRDFRGDTIHPSTLRVMEDLGLLDEFLRLPHQKAYELVAWIGDRKYRVADFRSLPEKRNFIALMPQWDFLDFVADKAREFSNFRLLMQTCADDLLREGDRVTGIVATGEDGPTEIRADLVIAADGRGSRLRAVSGLPVEEFGAPMDVLWFKLSRKPADPESSFGRVDAGRFLVMINRGDYWQCGCVIPKGEAGRVREAGIIAFRASIAAALPFVSDRIDALADWDAISLLTVQVNRLKQWSQPGLLCIGDAAHAMSPIGGVGVNLAVQDAVATANLLADKLHAGALKDADVALVQRRREFPTRATQSMQLAIQNRVVRRVLAADAPIEAPFPLRMLDMFPLLRRLPAWLIGMGFRPEHVTARRQA